MKIEQLYTECLSQGAYYIQSGSEAAIIDPLREVEPYITLAKDNHATIKYIFETHFHADFVSGHVTLSKKTGAPIVFGPGARSTLPIHVANDGEEFKLGTITIKLLHTPGHTMESSCFLLIDEHGKNHALFSGDTLFLGDVGRPDLAQKLANKTQEELAGMLYDSLREKILPLADDTLIYPGHGAGSACGKSMIRERVDTLGNQKKTNYALRSDLTKEEFTKEVLQGLLPPPGYFPANVKINKEGYKSIDVILEKSMKPLPPDEFERINKNAQPVLLDVRTPQEFAETHIPNSIFIGLDGQFAPWVGELIADVEQPILLIAPEGRVKEAVTRLARIGFDNTRGYLEGGIKAWLATGKQADSIDCITAEDFWEQHNMTKKPVFDVRKQSEYAAEHIEGAENAPLSCFETFLNKFPTRTPFYVHCAGGYRSMIAASLLKAKGAYNPINVEGGFYAMRATSRSAKKTCSLVKRIQ